MINDFDETHTLSRMLIISARVRASSETLRTSADTNVADRSNDVEMRELERPSTSRDLGSSAR
jgi:hypothetical protein